jgi:hypothetical protein
MGFGTGAGAVIGIDAGGDSGGHKAGVRNCYRIAPKESLAIE